MVTKRLKIIGAGPVGSLLALSLSNSKNLIKLYDNKSINNIIEQDKTYAITHSTKKLLLDLEIWDSLDSYLHPFQSLILKDNVIDNDVLFNLDDIRNVNSSSNAIGWIIEHRDLMKVIISNIKCKSNIELEFNTSINSGLKGCDYCFAADGITSRSRKDWNIFNYRRTYPQSCLTFKVLVRGTDSITAYEVFTKQGPLAILPLGNSIFQIIWTASNDSCNRRLALQNSYLLDELASYLPQGIEPDQLLSKPKIFKTGISISYPIIKHKKFLLGEAAHCVHPVGGQGLNLSYRDVYSISKLFRQKLIANYLYSTIIFQSERFIDMFSTAFATDLLIKLFSNNSVALRPIKETIFFILKKNLFIKRLTLSIMTNGILGSIISIPSQK